MNGQRSHMAANTSFIFLSFSTENGMRNRPRMYPWRFMQNDTFFFYSAKLTATILSWRLFFLLPKGTLLVLLIRHELLQIKTRSRSMNICCLDASVPEIFTEEYIIWTHAQKKRHESFSTQALPWFSVLPSFQTVQMK